jgi:hypothetical protein
MRDAIVRTAIVRNRHRARAAGRGGALGAGWTRAGRGPGGQASAALPATLPW